MSDIQYTARHRSILQAIAQGRAQLIGCRQPGLCVDGLWCDQLAVADLVRNELVRPAHSAAASTLVPAVLTEAGSAVLALLAAVPVAA